MLFRRIEILFLSKCDMCCIGWNKVQCSLNNLADIEFEFGVANINNLPFFLIDLKSLKGSFWIDQVLYRSS